MPVLPELFEAGVDWFQYRRSGVSDDQALATVKQVMGIAGRSGVRVVVNDRPDLALAAGSYGVHLGEDDLPPGAVKQQWPDLVVGVTQRAFDPLKPEADYYSVGPVFDTPSKTLDEEPCGWDGVRDVLRRADRPVFAIGGVTPDRLAGAPDGLAGVSVISSVWEASDPIRAVRELQSALRHPTGERNR